MITNVLSSALQGLQAHQKNFLNSANRISRWGTQPDGGHSEGISLEREMVGMMESRRGYEANLRVVKTADEMLGSLLDILG